MDLPECIRPKFQSEQTPRLGSRKEAIWMKRQKLVINISKYYLESPRINKTEADRLSLQDISTLGSYSSDPY